MIQDLRIYESDVGLRRDDSEVIDGILQFSVVVDVGMGRGYLSCQTDWRTVQELRDYAQRIIDAVNWLEQQ